MTLVITLKYFVILYIHELSGFELTALRLTDFVDTDSNQVVIADSSEIFNNPERVYT